MKFIHIFFPALFIVSGVSGKENVYTGSTPAAPVIRSFLGIPLTDSIDFIRWKLVFTDKDYHLQCNYGIGKPNTNGFYNGGKKIEFTGLLKKEKNIYLLQSNQKTLKIAELNRDLLHLVNTDNSLLVGNGGWSYTLNNITPSGSDQVNMTGERSVLKDSMCFQGRTPCNVPGVVAAGTTCYKLKWSIVLYADARKNEPSTFLAKGTPWYKEGGRRGTWKIVTGKNNRVIYQLNDDKGNGFLYLLKLDEHLLVFTDADGKLLTGDEDFSYTLNRKNF